jgi:PAS domain S-box-containing protein
MKEENEQMPDDLKKIIIQLKKNELKLKASNQQLATSEQQLKAANQQLISSEKKLSDLFNNLDAGVVVHAPDTSITFSNPRASELLGLSKEQMKGKQAIDPYWKFINENNIPYSLEEFPVNKILSTKKPIYNLVVGVISSKDTKIVWLIVNGFPELNKNGNLKEIIISFVDITERKQVEQELKESEQQLKANNQQLTAAEQHLKASNTQLLANEQQLRAANQQLIASEKTLKYEKEFSENLLETANTIILTLDKDANITLFNKFAEKLTGYKKKEVLGKNWFDLFIPKQIGSVIHEVFNDVLKELPEVSSYEYPILCNTGSEKLISWKNTIIKNENGEISGILSIGNDITKQKQAEETMQESKERYRTFVDNASDAFYLSDMEGRFIDVNEAACNILGYTREELLKLSIPDVDVNFPPEKLSDILGSLAYNEPKTLESFHKKKNGNIFPVEVQINIFGDKKQPLFISLARDVRERKKSEVALKESEEKYRNLIERANDGICILQNGKVIFSNPRLIELWGGTMEEVINSPFTNFIHPEELNKLVDYYNRRLKGEKVPSIYDSVLLQKNGDNVFVELSAGIITYQGNPADLIIIRDVSERKRGEEALQKSEEKFRSIFENKGTATGIFGEDSIIRDCNNIFIELSGYSRTEIIDKMKWSDFVVNEDMERMQEYHSQHSKKGSSPPSQYECRIIDKRGELIDTIVNISIVDKIRIVSLIDITERKLAEEKLIESEEKHRKLIETTSEGFWLIDHNKKIIDVNQALCLMIGYSRDEIIGKTPLNFVDEISHKIFAEKIIASKTTKHRTYEILLKKNDGNNLPTIVNATSLFDKNGKLSGSFAFVTDITERINIELDLKAALEKATESDRLKTAFLQNISHEIRTPMNGILGFTNLLTEPDLSGEEQQEYVEIINNNSDRMLNTINDLMDISMIESGQMKIAVSEVNVNNQSKELYTFFKPEAEKKGIQLSFINTLPTQEAIIKTDKNKLYSILTNLIKNAIKYSNKGKIEFGYEKKGEYLEFFVKDTGIGIPKDRQKAIFDRFVQADIEDRRAFEGSGLGLSISKAYVEMLRGRIWVESEEGAGSQFYFTIPYNPNPEEKTTTLDEIPTQKTESQITGLKVLIAEDVEEAHKYLTTVLKSFSKEILHSKTGIETIEISRNNPDIDLILMDIKMPKMSGYEATRKIREFNKDVIIIAQTAYALTGDREKALNAGCDDYISKPVYKEELMEMIKKYLGNR